MILVGARRNGPLVLASSCTCADLPLGQIETCFMSCIAQRNWSVHLSTLGKPTCGELTGWVVDYKGIVFRAVTTSSRGGRRESCDIAQQSLLVTKLECHAESTSRPRHPRNDCFYPGESKSSQTVLRRSGQTFASSVQVFCWLIVVWTVFSRLFQPIRCSIYIMNFRYKQAWRSHVPILWRACSRKLWSSLDSQTTIATVFHWT